MHKVWCAIDCGVAVNPDVIRAQIEGGIGFGLTGIGQATVAIVLSRNRRFGMGMAQQDQPA